MSGDRTYAQRLAEFATTPGVVPDDVASDAMLRVIDTVGNAIAALEHQGPDEPHRAVRRIIERRGAAGDATLLGESARADAADAAFYNGTLAHSLDFDDTHLPSVLHPSASIVPATLAVGQDVRSSGADVLRAIAIGIEVCNRIGMAAYDERGRNSVFFEKGQHATSICGTIGAAVAVSVLAGGDADQVASAIGIAASMGAGIIEANRTGGTVKRIHCGLAARAGIDAAMLALEGVTGPPTVFEGRFGFFRAYLDAAPDPDALVRGLGDDWETLRTVFKPYPSNHFTHPGIDCALELRRQGLDPSRITAIRLGVAAAPLRTIGEPREEKVRPRSAYHAKFSGPYTVATALLGGGGLGVYLDDFSDAAFNDPERLRIAELTEVVVDEVSDREFPRGFAAVIEVTTSDGARWEHRVLSSRGGPGHPLTLDEVLQKFELNANRVLSGEQTRRLRAALESLPSAPDIRNVLDAPHAPAG